VRLLLDTHTFLWFIGGSEELSRAARGLIEDPNNQRLLSVASLWEMAIKVSLGKLKLDLSFVELAEREIRGNAIELLVIRPDHLDELAKLPFHHRDPFDRLLVATAMVEGLTLVSSDTLLAQYPIPVIDARR